VVVQVGVGAVFSPFRVRCLHLLPLPTICARWLLCRRAFVSLCVLHAITWRRRFGWAWHSHSSPLPAGVRLLPCSATACRRATSTVPFGLFFVSFRRHACSLFHSGRCLPYVCILRRAVPWTPGALPEHTPYLALDNTVCDSVNKETFVLFRLLHRTRCSAATILSIFGWRNMTLVWVNDILDYLFISYAQNDVLARVYCACVGTTRLADSRAGTWQRARGPAGLRLSQVCRPVRRTQQARRCSGRARHPTLPAATCFCCWLLRGVHRGVSCLLAAHALSLAWFYRWMPAFKRYLPSAATDGHSRRRERGGERRSCLPAMRYRAALPPPCCLLRADGRDARWLVSFTGRKTGRRRLARGCCTYSTALPAHRRCCG
jgi:hypothetical protein